MQDKKRQVYYSANGDGLIFIPKAKAHELGRLWHAYHTAKTWGDFKGLAPKRKVKVFTQILSGGDYPVDMSDEAPFTQGDLDDICGWYDWPSQAMLYWIPEEIQEQHGRVESSVLDGWFLILDEDRTAEIVAAMEEHGFECIHNEEMVDRALGNF